MTKRLNITLPDRTVQLMNRVAGKGQRSALINRAVTRYVREASLANLRKQLAGGSRANADFDLKLAEEWFSIEASEEDTEA